MTTPIVLNPKTGFTIAQGTSSFAAELVTNALISWGPNSGGPYPSSYNVGTAVVATDVASGTILVPIAAVPLPEGVSYAIAEVTNAAGNSLVSDEVGVQILAVPAAPTFSVA
jgi:hypothetical protein